MRYAIRENNPTALRRSLPRARVGDVNDFILAKPYWIALAEDGESAGARVAAQDPIPPSRRIFSTSQHYEKDGAEKNPRRVDCYDPST